MLFNEAYLKSLNFSDVQIYRSLLMNKIVRAVTKDKAKLVLKGGTALVMAYQLQRYSTDLDYDGTDSSCDIRESIERGAKEAGITIENINLKKDTNTVKRYMVHYKESMNEPLKIEISYRNADDLDYNKDVIEKDGVRVYSIERLAEMKIEAFTKRIAARDVFHVAFILKHYPKAVNKAAIKIIDAMINRLGMESIETIMNGDDIIKTFDCESIILEMFENVKRKNF